MKGIMWDVRGSLRLVNNFNETRAHMKNNIYEIK
jgi:hypothetical protein